jgi:hypothetical protein
MAGFTNDDRLFHKIFTTAYVVREHSKKRARSGDAQGSVQKKPGTKPGSTRSRREERLLSAYRYRPETTAGDNLHPVI